MRTLATHLTLIALSFSSIAAADEPKTGDQAEARALFMAGMASGGDGRWDDARRQFERSYDLFASAPALFNLAFSLRALGRHREARDAFRKLIDGHGTELPREAVLRAEELHDEEAKRVGRLVVHGLAGDGQEALFVDGRALPAGSGDPPSWELNPGPHALLATAPGNTPFRFEGQVPEGGVLHVQVELEPTGTGRWPAWKTATVLTVVGAGILSAIVGGAVVAKKNAQLEPASDRSFSL